MMLAADHPDRKHGLVFKDDALANVPATHVLIIGVGAYRSPKFKRPLTTTIVSARAVADWFVNPQTQGFRNPECPLGSLAIALSESTDGGSASYGGGEIPRAAFEETRKAVRAWVQRINSHKDNLAILYIASHGESFLGRTAFLLEDYGLDALDATSGMSELDQLAGALENATPVSQLLLFDCCRTPTDIRLPWQEEFGTKLLSLTRQPDDHGEPRKQWVIAATSLGEAAIGRTNQTTLFADALISALDGVASDPTNDGWPVPPGNLMDKITRLLSLHRLPDENTQVAGGRMAGSFNITFPGEPQEVPVYISLTDPGEWPDSEITVASSTGSSVVIQGKENEPPFRRMKFPAATEVVVGARKNGANFGQSKSKAYAPAIFMEIKKTPQPAPTVVGELKDGRSFGQMAKLLLSVDCALQIKSGAVAEIVRRDDPKKNPKRVAVSIGGQTPVELRPGDHLVTLRTPDGRIEMQEVIIENNQILEVRFSTLSSPHEWLTAAAITGAIHEYPLDLPKPYAAQTASADVDNEALPPDSDAAVDRDPEFVQPPRKASIFSDASYHVEFSLNRVAPPAAMVETAEVKDDGRLVRLDFVEQTFVRFIPYMENPPSRPLFALVEGGNRRELAVIPSLGQFGSQSPGGWISYILADRLAPLDRALSTIIVEDSIWGGLLGFLTSRDMQAGGKLIEEGLTSATSDAIAREAIEQKLGNPLAALAGALVAVASSQPDIEQRWDPWLRNLSEWFPGIPDGPIILGRRLLIRARSSEQIAEARDWFFKGFDRGAPIFSLSADWLARGLESIPGDDEDLRRRRLLARRFASRVDPAQAFTVIRIDD